MITDRCSTSVKHDLPNICHHLVSECDDHDKVPHQTIRPGAVAKIRSGLEVANVKNLQYILHEDIMLTLNDRHD